MSSVFSYQIGLHVHEIDTPALLLNLEAMEHNLKTMAAFFADREVKIRPHVKLHKATPVLAHMQLNAGSAVGITCAKLSEAEQLAQAGIRDILIANQVVGPLKVRRLASVATYSDIMVAVDDLRNAEKISEAAVTFGTKVRVLLEIDIGHHRCGVQPFEPALELARKLTKLGGVEFAGIMGYDGHCTMKVSAEEREDCAKKANRLLAENRRYLEDAGLEVAIVSGAGTFTYRYAAEIPGITEIQAGTYLLNDSAFIEAGVTEFKPALSVLATIISRQRRPDTEQLAIIDMGRKAIDTYYGLPKVKSPVGAKVTGLSQEHGRVVLDGDARHLDIGDKLEFWVSDANGTINIYDKFYALRGDRVEAVWPIPGRGKAT